MMNTIKVVAKRKINADNQQIITAAYNHLTRFPPDARHNKPEKSSIMMKQKLLDTVQEQ